MNPTVDGDVITKTNHWGGVVVSLLLALLAAVIITAPDAQAATLSTSISGTPTPGNTVTVTGTYTLGASETFVSSQWSMLSESPATISDSGISNTPGSHSTDITLGSDTEYAAYLVEILKKAPISAEDLPADLKLQPINEIEKGLQDRTQVVAINPLAYDETAEVVLRFTVVTSVDTYTKDVTLTTELPWVVNTGVRTVPVSDVKPDQSVLLIAKCGEEPVLDNNGEPTGKYECVDQTSFQWQITKAPGGSEAALVDADTRTPWFAPDVSGTYVISVAATGSSNYTATLDVHAGFYHGAIDPKLTLKNLVDGEGNYNGDGRPEPDENCLGCHNDTFAPDKFTSWRQTGHAEAFYLNLETSDHFGESCFSCHSVGFDRGANGFDDHDDYSSFLTNLMPQPASEQKWIDMLNDYPDLARLSNIQCENCHGPQDYTEAHKNQPGAPRISLNSDVCGSCHGEPGRHGRFQQWQLSSHADYDLARERGTDAGTHGSAPNCARCHSGNGFIQWSEHGFDPNYLVNVTWDEDTVVPQTCATCHDPHNTGTFSGKVTDAKVRIMGDTNILLASFQAKTVGKAATCMTCHNSRADALRTDADWANLSNSQKESVPHHGVQADLIMGQNAYFMSSDDLVRGKHSLIPNVCVTCHMEKTDPPADLAYQNGGTNHTFAADPNICSDCHGEGVTADSVSAVVNSELDDLQNALSQTWKDLMVAQYNVKKYKQITIPADACGTANDVVADNSNPITNVDYVHYYGGTHLSVTVGSTTCSNLSASDILVGKPSNNSKNNLTLETVSLQSGNDVLWKAQWNYSLLYEDSASGKGARGVHNPDFSIKALTRALTAIQNLDASITSQ